ncbi:MAG: hypothetical protein Q4B58_03755 [Bacteroidales bacterium]|nr:hypothetical protein [Bacteroidales bacterium]
MEWPVELVELFDEPMFAGVKVPATPVTADDRTQKKIEELRAWIAANGREPQMNGALKEKLLCVALQTLKETGLWQ